jgi:hypothetical protein
MEYVFLQWETSISSHLCTNTNYLTIICQINNVDQEEIAAVIAGLWENNFFYGGVG